MERRGEDRDIGMPNSSINYDNPSQINPEITPLKLPLAPIVSTPSDKRANPTVTTRRGSSIFSPTQTIDHHHHQPPRQQQKDDGASPDPDPASTSAGGASNSRTPPPPPAQLQAPPSAVASSAASPVIRYRECLKNHAATMGGHVVDGCGEFMPSGDDGTTEALRCAACDCHRNFHRREIEGGDPPPQQTHYYSYTTPNSGNNRNAHRNPFFQTQNPPHHHLQKHSSGPTPPAMVNFGGGSPAAESSSEDLNMFQSSGGGHAVNRPSKKRFRTKFSQEQKDRMQELAEKLGWRIQKQDEQEVEQFCNETGIKRQVFKVWMHNNKQAMKKRQT